MYLRTKLVLVVDGKTEKALKSKIDESHCKVRFVQRQHNGKDVSLQMIATECSKLLNACYTSGTNIVLIVDRENRSISDHDMEKELGSIIKKNFTGEFQLVVANQMFENWILSDIENVSKSSPTLLRETKNSTDHEGSNGTKVLNGLWISNRGEMYASDKISNAQLLFKHVRTHVGVINSVSFKRFRDILNSFNINIF